jgi:hypothetical protein
MHEMVYEPEVLYYYLRLEPSKFNFHLYKGTCSSGLLPKYTAFCITSKRKHDSLYLCQTREIS